MALNYSQQLLEMKRKSRLTGKPISTQQTATLNKQYASGAAGRLGQSGNIQTAPNTLQAQIGAYGQLLDEFRAQNSSAANQAAQIQAAQIAKLNSLSGGGTLDLTPYIAQINDLQNRINTLSSAPQAPLYPSVQENPSGLQPDFPNNGLVQTLQPGDPRLQAPGIETSVRRGGEVPANQPTSTAPDTVSPFLVTPQTMKPAAQTLDPNDPINFPTLAGGGSYTDEQKAYAAWLRNQWLGVYGGYGEPSPGPGGGSHVASNYGGYGVFDA